MNYGYVVAEGPHDVELIGRLLRPHGIARIKLLTDLDPYFHPLVPRNYPAADGDLLKRIEVPTFFASPACTIAVRSAGGDSRLVRALQAVLVLDDWETRLGGVGVLLDADAPHAPRARLASFRAALLANPDAPRLALAEEPGVLIAGPPRCGAFVLPDNRSPGTLEDLLLEAGEKSYPELLSSARTYIASIDHDPVAGSLTKQDLEGFRRPQGAKKATLAAMASVLKPGKAIQTSIQDNRWLDPQALALPRLQAVQGFLLDLLGLPPLPGQPAGGRQGG